MNQLIENDPNSRKNNRIFDFLTPAGEEGLIPLL
jgi:hypothetical protein